MKYIYGITKRSGIRIKKNDVRFFKMQHKSILMGIAIFLCLTVNLAFAQLYLQQNPDSITAERASVYDPLTDSTLYEKVPQSGIKWAAMGSTAKIMTIHVALEAVKAGTVSLNDMITISDKAAKQACNCFPGKLDGHWLVGGDRMTLDDALYSVALSHGEPTVAVAEFIAKAEETGSKEPAESEEESLQWENKFITMMNKEVDAIELVQTKFMTVHGGDEPGQYTSPNDLIQIWKHAVESNEAFLKYTGMKFHTTTVYDSFHSYQFELGKSYNYHPGVDGDKGGNSGACKSCLVSQATRIGRTLIEANLQSNAYFDNQGNYHADNFKDGDKLFRRGFETLFLPEPRGQSDQWGDITDHDLACVSWHRAASAVVTPQGQKNIITWKLDLNESLIEELTCENPALPLKNPDLDKNPDPPDRLRKLTGTQTFKSGLRRSNVFGIGDDGNSPGNFKPDIDLTTGFAKEVEIIYVGGGHLVVAAGKDDGSLELSSWGIPSNCPAYFRDAISAGMGSDIKLQRINDGMFVSVHRSPDNDLILQSWSLNLENGNFDPVPLAKRIGPKVIEFDVSGRDQLFLDANLVTAIRSPNQNWALVSWTIYPQTGSIIYQDTDAGGNASILSVARVPGFGHIDIYATVLRRNASDKLKIIVHAFGSDGTLERVGERETNYAVSEQGIIAIEPFYEGGILVATKETKSSLDTVMSVWSLDEKDNGSVGVNFVTEERSGPLRELIGLCRVPDDQAEGDFLFAHRNFFDAKLELEAWRSAER